MRNDRDAREGGTSIYTMAGLAVLVVLALLFMWAPWSGPDNSAPFTTVGSSTTRPSANLSPSAPDPITPAAPSTTPATPSPTH
jgi:hypothetical protein